MATTPDSANVRRASWVSTCLGPNSTSTLQPSARIASRAATNSTGSSSCPASTRRFASTSDPYAAPAVFAYTGCAGTLMRAASTANRNFSTAWAT